MARRVRRTRISGMAKVGAGLLGYAATRHMGAAGQTVGRGLLLGGIHSTLRQKSKSYRNMTSVVRGTPAQQLKQGRAMLGKKTVTVGPDGKKIVKYQRTGLGQARQASVKARNMARQVYSRGAKAWRGASFGQKAKMVAGGALALGAAHWATKPLRAQAQQNRMLQQRYGMRGRGGALRLAAAGTVLGLGAAYARKQGWIGGKGKGRRGRYGMTAYARLARRKFAPTPSKDKKAVRKRAQNKAVKKAASKPPVNPNY